MQAMTSILQQACGYEFTNKLHRMFTDVTLSAELSTKFNDFLTTDAIQLNVNFSILVLQVIFTIYALPMCTNLCAKFLQ